MGTTWGQQQPWVQTECKKHREYIIEEVRGCAMWQHQSGPSQQAPATCHNPIGPCQHRWAPHWHGTPDKWVHTCHVTLTYWSTSVATSLDRDTWHNVIGANLHVSAG
jgi:hypothetical protein